MGEVEGLAGGTVISGYSGGEDVGISSAFSAVGALGCSSPRRRLFISLAMTHRGIGGKQLKQSIEVHPLRRYIAWALKHEPKQRDKTEIVKYIPPIMEKKWPNHPNHPLTLFQVLLANACNSAGVKKLVDDQALTWALPVSRLTIFSWMACRSKGNCSKL